MKAKSKDKANRSRKTAVLAVLLAGTTILAVAGIHFIYGQWETAVRQRDSAGVNFTAAFREMDSLFTAAMNEHMADRATSFAEWGTLLRAAKYFDDFCETNCNDDTLQAARARAFELKGQLYAEVSLAKQSAREFRQAQIILSKLAAATSHPNLSLYLASVNNRLAHLLAELGQVDEARTEAANAIATLEKLGDGVIVQSELAIAYHNSAMLTPATFGEQSAEKHLRKSIAVMEKLARERPSDIWTLERLVDEQQALVKLLCQASRYSEASYVCSQSLNLIGQLEKIPQKISDLELVTARNLAEANLKILQAAAAPVKPPTAVKPAGCMWIPMTKRDGKTIRSSMFMQGHMPAEFERHDALLLTFPWDIKGPGRKLVLDVLAAIAQSAQQHIQLVFLVPDMVAQRTLESRLRKSNVPLNKCRFMQLPSDTVWLRDYGPFSIVNKDGRCQLVDATYADCRVAHIDNRTLDDRVPTQIGRLLRMEVARTSVKLTGGNMLSNGKGLCLATKKLLEVNAILGHSEPHVTKTIMRLFGAQQVVYLDPLDGERTGDIDWFAAFTGPNTIVVGDYEGRDPVNGAILDRNAARLQKIVTASGPLRVVRIPMPKSGEDFFGGTYTNVVFANKILFVPTWSDPETEKRALEVYRSLLPNGKVIPIDITGIRLSQGGIRCMTAPLYRLSSWESTKATIFAK